MSRGLDDLPFAGLILVHHPDVIDILMLFAEPRAKLTQRHAHVERTDAARQQHGGDEQGAILAISRPQFQRFVRKLPGVEALGESVLIFFEQTLL